MTFVLLWGHGIPSPPPGGGFLFMLGGISEPVPEPGMDLPAVSLRCALTTQPLAAPSYTDMTSRLLGFSTSRGRESELVEFDTAEATFELRDDDRHLDPANSDSPYYGTLKPRRRWSLRATWDGVIYDIVDGHNKSFKPEWNNLHARHGIQVRDAFEMFAKGTLTTPFPAGAETRDLRAEERSDQRVAWVLDEYGWPAGRRILDTGVVAIQAHGYEGKNMREHLRELEEAEGGFLFMDAAGNVVFQNKHHRLTSFTTSAATFGDAGPELRYSAIDYEPQDVEHLINHVTGKRENIDDARTFEYDDSASQDEYGGPTSDTISLWAAADTEVEARTQYLVRRYSVPAVRIRSITIKPRRDPVHLWPQALGRVIGERITIKQRFYDIGAELTHEARIEGIRHDAQPGDWTTTFMLSPVVSGIDNGDYWQLGEPGSQLGADTVLAW